MSVTLEAKEQRIGPVGSQLCENLLKTAPYDRVAATRSSEQGLNGVTHAWSGGFTWPDGGGDGSGLFVGSTGGCGHVSINDA